MSRLLQITLMAVMLFPSCIMRKGAYPGTPWEATVEPQPKFDQIRLKELSTYLEDSVNTTGLVVIHQGKQVYQYGNIKQVSYIASCRKSVLSMLYGKHVENGTISLDQQIGDLGIDEEDGLLPIEKTATVDHIITSRSGVFHLAANGGYDLANFKERGSVEPGSYFVYNNWDFNVGGHILEQATGQSIYQEIEEQLAIPLGLQDWHIKNQRKGGKKKKSRYLAYHMYFSTRDMAKIGQLMLNKGQWNGRQLISENWIQKITSPVTPHEVLGKRYGSQVAGMPDLAYGYMWWLIDDLDGIPAFKGAYTASGYGGQYVTILPAVDMVVAHKTKLDVRTLLGMRYKATRDGEYYHIIKKILDARL